MRSNEHPASRMAAAAQQAALVTALMARMKASPHVMAALAGLAGRGEE